MSEKKARLKRKTTGEMLPVYNFTEGSNRSIRRHLKNRSLRNFDRQVVPAKSDYVANSDDPFNGGKWVVTPAKVVFHKKINNLPRLYPNMKG